MNKINIFLHVEKTGGMSFEDLLANNFREGKHIRYPRSDGETFNWENIQCIYGHFHINWPTLKRDFGDRPKRFYTFLRDPVDRVWSHYHHTNGPQDHGHIDKWLNSMDRDRKYYHAYSNRQVYALTGHEDITTQSLEIAKLKLEEIDFGITEYFYNSIMLFQKGNPEVFKTLDFEYLNFTKNKIPMTANDKACIIPYVQFDMELYQYAKELFIRRWGDEN